MSKQVKIMSGIAGSGKSTIAADMEPDVKYRDGGNKTLVSADHFFLDRFGHYNFNPAKLSEAHGQCFRNFIEAMQSDVSLIVVDNTNTTSEEITPYVLGAQAFGYECEIITVSIRDEIDGIQKCADRNSHGVPYKTIQAQQSRLAGRKLPPWWKETVIPAKF
jgi:predicted ABC-type ATPase